MTIGAPTSGPAVTRIPNSGPYRVFETCEEHKDRHGSPVLPIIYRSRTWCWGPFAAGTVVWGSETYRVWATPWFSFWFRTRGE